MQYHKEIIRNLLFFFFLLLVVDNKAHSIYFGPQVIKRDFSENLPSPLKSSEKGILYGFKGGIDLIIGKIVYIDANIEYEQGKTHYTGTKQNLFTKQIQGFKSLTDNDLLNIEGSLGFLIPYKRLEITPFFGPGYHLWNRILEDYSEKYKWPYFHFGSLFSYNILPIWKIGFEAKAMQTKFAELEIKGIYPWPQNLDMDNKLQYSIKVVNTFDIKYIDICLSVFYKNLKIGPSKNIKKSSLSAPSSTDKLLGVELLLKYLF